MKKRILAMHGIDSSSDDSSSLDSDDEVEQIIREATFDIEPHKQNQKTKINQKVIGRNV